MKLRLAFAAGAFALVASSFAGGAVYSETGWGANDSIDWGQFGPDFTVVASGTHGSTANGIGFTVYSINDGSGADDGQGNEVRTEGQSWNGNFNPGDHLLYKYGSHQATNSDLAIVFDQAVGGVGTAGQTNAFGAFNLNMGVWDGVYPGGNAVGFAATTGTNTGAEDGTNPFLGYVSDSNNIVEMAVAASMVDGSDDQGSGWGHTLIKDNATPEPASMAALGLGVAAFIRRRRAKKA